ncbi:MAG: pilus assembly protein PilM [Oscillospiraceae bacterium]|nr:pilus assembly protein PilM [Oscillospiraceae bacterium]
MLSFDITDRNIRIIKGTESNGKIRINSAATLNLDADIIENGHVCDVPRLATQINQVLRTNKLADKEAIVSISSNMTIFKELHIQKATKEQDFMKMVRAEMSAALGIDDSYSVSYIIVGDSDQLDGGVKVLATACPYEVVDSYKRVFSMLQINLRSVMIGCNCITKVLLADTKVKSKMPLLAVQIDNNFISLNLYEKGQLSFSRFASISAEDYAGSSDYVFEAVNENIFRMLQFQKSKTDGENIENVIFYGDTHEYVRLTNELEKMGIRTSIINVPPQIHGYENLEFSSYANAIGAMFKRNKETERINLLETDTINNNKIKSDSGYIAILLTSLAAAAGIVALGTAYFGLSNMKVKSDIEELEKKKSSALCTDLTQQLADLKELRVAVNNYYNGVYSANEAYKSRPYLLSEDYTLIEDTIKKVALEVYADEGITEDTVDQFYVIEKMDYQAGTFTLDMKSLAQGLPMEVFPEKVYEALNGLNEVYNVSYDGYDIAQAPLHEGEQQQKAAAPQVDAEGNPIEGAVANQQNDEKPYLINMSLNVIMKGDGISLEDNSVGSSEEAAQ